MKVSVTVLHESGKMSVLTPWMVFQHLHMYDKHVKFDGEAYNEGREDKGIGFQITAEYLSGSGYTSGFSIEDLMDALKFEKMFERPRPMPYPPFRKSMSAICISLRGCESLQLAEPWW